MSELSSNERVKEVLAAWQEVERISGPGATPDCKETLLTYLVEVPLREAVGVLYDRNIQTLSSSANALDYFRGYAGIMINWTNLSPENRAIGLGQGLEVVELDKDLEGLKLIIPINTITTPDEVGQQALQVAEKFAWQPFSWCPTFNLLEARLAPTQNGDLTDASEADIIKELTGMGYYFDENSRLFYHSEEHFIKSKEQR